MMKNYKLKIKNYMGLEAQLRILSYFGFKNKRLRNNCRRISIRKLKHVPIENIL